MARAARGAGHHRQTTRQTWATGLERAVFIGAAIVFTFTFVQFVGNNWVLWVFVIVAQFLCVATLNVNMGLCMFFFVTIFALGWALGDYDIAYWNGFNRVAAEVAGVAMALVAAAFLQWWAQNRQAENLPGMELANT